MKDLSNFSILVIYSCLSKSTMIYMQLYERIQQNKTQQTRCTSKQPTLSPPPK
ncbi:unnamed protein product [Absidia cylindrospora]